MLPPFLSEHVFWFLFFLFSMVFGILNLQNAASYFGKTDNCLKVPFLQHLEDIMISGSILAVLSSFFMMFVSFSVTNCFH